MMRLAKLLLLAAALLWGAALSHAASVNVGVTIQAPGGGNVPFAALHTYYLSPTGSDAKDGLTPATAWATPHHNIVCGDVILASAGTYSSTYGSFGTNSWGTVSNCPSTTGGIDGAGGVYFATLLCAGPDLMSCQVNGNGYEAFRVDQSNWAVEGFWATQSTKGSSGCYLATSEVAGATRHHIAFINDIASTCDSQGFADVTWTNPASGVDQSAVVGAIAFNTAQSLGAPCASGVSMIPVPGPDTSPGTHVFVVGSFAYNNVNAPSGATCNTDGEGLIFDSWACFSYPYQGVAEQNVWWGNGNAGFEVYPNFASCPSGSDISQVYVFGNTSYGNLNDTKNTGTGGAELYLNQLKPVAGTSVYSVYNNIFAASMSKYGGTGPAVFAGGVYVNNAVPSPVNVAGNVIWQGNPGTKTGPGNPNTNVYVNGARNTTSFPFGSNTYSNPGFANPGALPSAAPDCTGYANTTDCMLKKYGVFAALTPANAPGVGYRPPGACAADPYYPAWLKGVVYLHWDGARLWENAGLITQPCGM